MIVYLHALSPLHVGIGHSPSAIDLPIARDKATNFPIVPGSGLKGALRASARQRGKEVVRVFGPETHNASEHAGGLHFGDAQLVALPVRSLSGTFAWVSSPYLLMRLARDLKASGKSDLPKIPNVVRREQALVGSSQSALSAGDEGKDIEIYLEDLDFRAQTSSDVAAWGRQIASGALNAEWKEFFEQRFLVVHDDIMRHLSVYAIDISSRNRLENDTKTVAKGALWTEENLPSETILASFAYFSPNKRTLDTDGLKQVLSELCSEALFLGGNTSVGRGRCQLRLEGQQ